MTVDDKRHEAGGTAGGTEPDEALTAAQRLERLQAVHRALVRATSEAVWIADEDGSFTEPQPAWESYTGQAWPDHQGMAWIDMVHPDDRQGLRAGWDKALERGEDYARDTRLWCAAHEEYRVVRVRSASVCGPDGRVTGWVGTIDDIHEDLGHARDLEVANTELSRFIGAVAHDLKTPISSVKGFATLLPSMVEKGDIETAVEFTTRIIANSDRAANMIDNLLAYARSVGDQGVRGVVELPSVVQWVRETLAGALADNDAVVYLSDDVPAIRGNLTAIQQLFLNLISNSVKYRREGYAPIIRIEAEQQVDWVQVCVIDNGRGLPHGAEHQIFALGFRAADDIEGSGIGLASCRIVVERHGGQIWVGDPPEGGGTSICFSLPAAVTSPTPG